MLPVWDDSFSVHNEKIDEQHKKLFELAGYAYICADRQISRTEIKQLLKGFFDYMREHFDDEEEYMRSIGYPRLEAHHRIHEEIIAGFSEVVKTTSNTNELKEKLGIIAKNWLLQHILKEDMQIEEYRSQAESQGTLPKAAPPKPKVSPEKAKVMKAQYVCGCANKKHIITLLVHQKIEDGKHFNCKTCKQPMQFEKFVEV